MGLLNLTSIFLKLLISEIGKQINFLFIYFMDGGWVLNFLTNN